MGKQRITLYGSFLEDKNVKDVIEIDKNLVLVVTFKRPEYFVVDLQLKKIFELGNGSSKFGLSLTLLPGYDPVACPYILCKESEGFAILDPLNNLYSEIFKFPQSQGRADPDPSKDETIIQFEKN